MDNKVLVQVIIPDVEISYDVFIPISKRIGNVIQLIIKAINDYGEYYPDNPHAALYSRETGAMYDINSLVYDTDIRNGSQIVLI